jgi:hypothetical protein
MFYRLLIAAPILLFSLAAHNNTPAPSFGDNVELIQLFNEDQRVRQSKPLGPDEAKITRTDADRLARVKEMITQDQIQTTADFRRAAFIVQHSSVRSDYLLAHTLAVICASDGDRSCLWLSTATLDRYLQSFQQPQIYGTQYVTPRNAPATQQPYNDALISDGLRKRLGVPSIAAQKKQLDNLNASR